VLNIPRCICGLAFRVFSLVIFSNRMSCSGCQLFPYSWVTQLKYYFSFAFSTCKVY
jgi:hypothetical protein